MNKDLSKLVFLNRQPTLWRHGIGAVKMLPLDSNDDVISISPLMLEPYNADFDGDTVAIYAIHDIDALKELEEKAYIKNTITYDVNNSMLSTVRHEALYCVFILSYILTPEIGVDDPFHLESLQDLPENDQLYNNYLYYAVNFKGRLYTYGLCLLNKWCGFDDILIEITINSKFTDYLSRTIYDYYNDNTLYYEHLTDLNKKLYYFISTTEHCPSVNINEMLSLVDDTTDNLFKKLPERNPIIGYYINEALIDRCIDNFDPKTDLYKLYKSGSRFKRPQLARSFINVGYTADDRNFIIPKPVKTNLMCGLSPEDFFRASPGSRKGIADKAQHTPQSGYLERTLTMSLSPLEIAEEDCGSLGMQILIFSKDHAETLIGKYYRDIYSQTPHEWKLLTKELAISNINKEIIIRSPITCLTPGFKMCRKCFGEKKLPTKYLGIVAAQSLAERLTQLIMRSFHTSGSASLEIDNSLKDFLKEHMIDIINNINQTIIVCDTNEIPDFSEVGSYNSSKNNMIYFDDWLAPVENKDAVKTMKEVKELLKKQTSNVKTPRQYYEEMMTAVLNVGAPYSSFVEMLFANMFITDKDSKEFWRYNQHKPITLKLGDKVLASYLSNLLGLLYQPNKKTLEDTPSLGDLDLDTNNLNIYEKIWLGLYS